MYAVIRTGNKQYRVEEGKELLVERLHVEAGKPLELTDVLLFSDGKEVKVGQPQLPVSVHCLCLGEEKGDKLRTFKYRRRHNYYRRYGHRQTLTRLRVEKIERKG
ncbi:MAG: 50S ribosomal protein L21 [Pseudomonadota bacterium]